MALPALLPPLLLLAATAPGPGMGTGMAPEPGPEPGPVPADPPLPAQPPDALFAAGAEAYSRGDWPAVVLQMERALRARAAVRSRLVRCRLRCANATAGPAEGTEPQTEPVLRDLLFFRGLLRRAACLRGCGPAAPSRYRLGDELDREFSKRSPYNYLQVAYFKVRDRRRDRREVGGGRGGVRGRRDRQRPREGTGDVPVPGGCGMPGGIPGAECGTGPREPGGGDPGAGGGVPGPGRGPAARPGGVGGAGRRPRALPVPPCPPPGSATSEPAGAAPVTALRPGCGTPRPP